MSKDDNKFNDAVTTTSFHLIFGRVPLHYKRGVWGCMTSNDNGENDMVKGNNNQRLQMIYGGHILYSTTKMIRRKQDKTRMRQGR